PAGELPLTFRRRRLLAGDRAPRSLARPRVGMRTLPADGQVAAVAEPAIAAPGDEPLDVPPHLAPPVALDLVVGVDLSADARDLVVGQVVGLAARIDLRTGTDAQRQRSPDPVDVGERYLHALVARQIDARDACHVLSPLPLSLLVPRIRALDPDDALTP